MELNDLRRKLKSFVAELEEKRESNCLRITTDLIGLIKLRLSKGIDSNGKPFVKYAQSTIRQRSKKGFQTNHVDFNQTGRLYANIVPKVIEHKENRIKIQIGGFNNYGKRLLEWQSKIPRSNPRGNILSISDDELKMVQTWNERRIRKLFNKHLK